MSYVEQLQQKSQTLPAAVMERVYGDIAYSEDWSDLLENSPAPVRMVIGADDRNVQWGAAKRWAAAHDHIELITLPKSGYFVLHQHSSRFLKWAKEDLKLLEKPK